MRQGKFISVDGIRTHYFEAGESHRGRKASVLLLHSAEYGGAAEFSWEFNLEALGREYHVLVPDHLGFGLTDKIFDFNGQFDRRITHIKRFIDMMGVGRVHVMGSSMSGGLCLTVAARKQPDWPLRSVVCCSGGGDAPNQIMAARVPRLDAATRRPAICPDAPSETVADERAGCGVGRGR